ncbi:MAG TPA: outer membrane beta-barrel protein [Desulfuromonadales bacterium]|nr:outer membrane beta-barrel protein [Desulfuromonadales bacterium]
MAKNVFALILIMLISATLQPPAMAADLIEPTLTPAAEIIKPKPKPKPETMGGFSISSTVGSYFFAGSEQRNVAALYGVKVGHEKIGKSAADNLGLEATINFFNASSKTVARDASGYLFRLDASYPFPINKKWMPYLVAGVGGIFSDGNGSSNKNILLNYGLGLKYFLQNYLAIRADVRHVGVYENSIFRQNVDIGVGLSYYFGKERIKKIVTQPVLEKKKIVVIEDDPAKNVEAKKTTATEKEDKSAVKPSEDLKVPEIAPPVKIEVVKKLSVDFDGTSLYIKPVYIKRFNEIAASLYESGDFMVHIKAHSRDTEKIADTVILSEKRVQRVRDSFINLGVNPNQISINANAALPVNSENNANSYVKAPSQRVDIMLVKLDAAAKLKTEQELQFKIERDEIERLVLETRSKDLIKAVLELHGENRSLPVDSATSLPFELVNQGEDTEEFMLMLSAPKDFDGFMESVSRPDDKITLIQLAPREKLKGNVRFRIPAGLIDGQKTMLTLKAVSTRFNDVVFQKDSQIAASAPLLRIEAKLSNKKVSPGDKLQYQLTIINSGSLSAHALSVKLSLPSAVNLVGASGAPFAKETGGMLVFKVDTIEAGKQAEITIDANVRADSSIGQEILWNAEVIDGTLQRRAKSTERSSIVLVK